MVIPRKAFQSLRAFGEYLITLPTGTMSAAVDIHEYPIVKPVEQEHLEALLRLLASLHLDKGNHVLMLL